MACRYHDANNLVTTSGTNKTATSLQSIAGLRPFLDEFTMGADGAPNSTDCSIVFTLQLWTTSAGTAGNAYAAGIATDPGFQAAKTTQGGNFSAEPTYTASALMWGPMGINQRATYRWTAMQPSGVVTLVGTATTGVGMQVKSTNYAGQTDVAFYHQE